MNSKFIDSMYFSIIEKMNKEKEMEIFEEKRIFLLLKMMKIG